MPDVIREDDKSYYTDTGNYVPKATMSPAVRELYQSKLNDYQSRTGMIPATAPVQNTGMSPVSEPMQSVMQPAVPPMANPGIDAGGATAADYVPPAAPQQPGQAQLGSMPMSMTTSTDAPQSSVTQKSIAPETQQALDKASAGLIAAEKSKTQAELEAVKVQSEFDQQIAKTNLETAKIQQEHEAKRQSALATANADYSAGVKELAGMKVDPNKIWADKTTGDKILVGVGILLGAFGQALTGGKSNYALDVIDQAIDRDIAAQKSNIGAKQAAVGEKANAIAVLRQRFGDERLADIAFKDAALDRVKSTFLEKIAATKSADVRARGQDAIAKISEQQSRLRLEATTINTTLTSGGERVATTVETPKTGVRNEDPLWTAYGRAPDAEAAKAVRTADAAYKEGKGELKNYEGKIKSLGTLSPYKWGTKEKGDWDAATESVKNTLRQVKNMGVLQPSESKELENRLGGIKTPAQLTSYATELQNWLDRAMQSKLSAYGINRGTTQPAVYTPPSYAGAK